MISEITIRQEDDVSLPWERTFPTEAHSRLKVLRKLRVEYTCILSLNALAVIMTTLGACISSQWNYLIPTVSKK